MTTEMTVEQQQAYLAEMKEDFGPIPIQSLSTESSQAFDRILLGLIKWLNPRDYLEKMLLWNFTILNWEILRLSRQKSLKIDRKFREMLQYQAQRAREYQPQRARAALGQKKSNLARLAEKRLSEFNEDQRNIEEILAEKPDEVGHAAALEQGVNYFPKLDALLDAAFARHDNSLDQLERYRVGFGSALRKNRDKLIELETAPSLVPQDAA